MTPIPLMFSQQKVRRQRSLLLEPLENRRLLALLIHDYELNGSYADSLGGPSLVPAGGTLNATNYSFAPNQGLSLSNGIDSSNYSIALDFQLSDASGGYRKIIDFKDRTEDAGLYDFETELYFYPEANGPDGDIPDNTEVEVVLTRDAATQEVVGYVNGVARFNFIDTSGDATFTAANNIIQFFKDDSTTSFDEASGGSVDRILIFGQPLTETQVSDLFEGILPGGLPECDITTLNEPGRPGTAQVTEDADNPNSNVLIVTGTSRSDVITVEPQPKSDGMFRVVQNKHVLAAFISSDVERIVIFGEEGNDKITISPLLPQSAVIFGGSGNDTIVGGGGDTEIDGGDGNDKITGGFGVNVLCGGNGNDVIVAGVGTGMLFGDAGNDKLVAGLGDDQMFGGDGNDTLVGGAGSDELFGQAGNDILTAGAGNSILVGGDGNDTLVGGPGRNLLIGGTGRDKITGGSGDEILIAGSTIYDEDQGALEAILAEWAAAGGYEDRVGSIGSGAFVLDDTTVLDDGVTDILIGGAGRDWFFIGVGDKIKDRAPNEFVDAEGV